VVPMAMVTGVLWSAGTREAFWGVFIELGERDWSWDDGDGLYWVTCTNR